MTDGDSSRWFGENQVGLPCSDSGSGRMSHQAPSPSTGGRSGNSSGQAPPTGSCSCSDVLLTLGLSPIVRGHRELTEEEKHLSSLRSKRDDEQEVRDRLLKQERQDILRLWGVDCPPDINNTQNYNRRLMDDKGMVSGWFQQEFNRIGGDWDRLWSHR